MTNLPPYDEPTRTNINLDSQPKAGASERNLPPVTNDDKVLDELRSVLDGYPAGTYGPDDEGLPAMGPRFVHARWKSWLRGGLPSSSVPEAISSSFEHPMPVTQATSEAGVAKGPPRVADVTDDEISRARRQYTSLLLTALSQLRMARAIENKWRYASAAVPDEPTGYCSNCKELFKGADLGRGKEKDALCSRCRKHFARHRVHWPKVRSDPKKESAA